MDLQQKVYILEASSREASQKTQCTGQAGWNSPGAHARSATDYCRPLASDLAGVNAHDGGTGNTSHCNANRSSKYPWGSAW